MKIRAPFWIALWGLATGAFGEIQPSAGVLQYPQQSKTKLEWFQAKTGAVIVMGSGEVGTLPGQAGSAVAVETREFTDAGTGAKQSGVCIKVKEAGQVERESASYVDLDEIEPLIQAIDYISTVNNKVTKLAWFEADYRTRGDLTVTTFGKTETSAAIKSGAYAPATASISVKDLATFKNLLQSALVSLEAVKAR